jgi:hypothetical protein
VVLALSMVDERKADQAKDGDRRSLKRTRVSRNAKIIVPRRSSVIFCTSKTSPAAALVCSWRALSACPGPSISRSNMAAPAGAVALFGEPATSSAWHLREREHDPEKWPPVCGKDHASIKQLDHIIQFDRFLV